MLQRLPSMPSLRAFEATARHLSFTRAATELNLTQGAVSHQIRGLEDMLGLKLFIREGNAIRITEAGQEYLSSARLAITEMLVATERAVDRQRGDILTIACLGTFAIKCLMPNLPDFVRAYPSIGLKVRTLVPSVSALPSDYDVAIQYGVPEDWPDLAVVKITDEELFPVCSPALLKGERAICEPQDLAAHTIIRTASPWILRDDWPLWMEKAGIGGTGFAAEMTCDLLYPSYQAAIEGLGVAMGRSAVVAADIAAGRLVEPFRIRLGSALGYHLVMARERSKLSKVESFRNWALGRFYKPLKP
ncbi:transcriptional regulator GcvA [Roseiarcaceae bacterium H3SJ34-1]|uniref:transcriptional regulator GcvA n=1 Tax=Terripilifer ovatus TaxID=3032367 RepID=UPI003AB98E65|nr:transcriptional regulator GcvA [Roseiarcaceae bacterium H3SJ34-1]